MRLQTLTAELFALRIPPTLGPMTQWLVQATHNRLIAGSNPAGPILDKSLFEYVIQINFSQGAEFQI
jgi:hypothetical protein